MAQTWHGFPTFIDFLRSAVSLGTTIGVVLWFVLTAALDTRYASKSAELHIPLDETQDRALAIQVQELRARVLAGQILTARLAECRATIPSSRIALAAMVNDLEREYQEAGGGVARILPDCDVVRD